MPNAKYLSSSILLAAFLLLTFFSDGSQSGASNDWAISSSGHRLLPGKMILAVGSVSKQEVTNSRTFQRSTWYEFVAVDNSYMCFSIPGYTGYWGYGTKAAMIVSDESNSYYVAFMGSTVGAISVDLHPLRRVTCPDL